MSPADRSLLTKAPSKVVLTFDENIRTPSKIVVDGPDGSRVDHGGTGVVDNKVSVHVDLRPVPQDVGRYTVAYRVVSADGHPVAGTKTFRYAPPGVRAAPVTSSADRRGLEVVVADRLGGRRLLLRWPLSHCVLMLPRLRQGRRP